jgi:hypothetical protein
MWGHEIMAAALRKTGVCAAFVSEESPDPIEMAEGKGPNGLVVACDPVHVACCPWLRERGVAMVGSDTHNDIAPLPYPSLGNSFHVVSLVAMGLWLIDNANLEDVARAAAERSRWEFLLTIAPLRLKNVTGSPVNPIAVF